MAVPTGLEAAVSTSQGGQLAASCAACHAAQAHDGAIPTILGWNEQRLAATMMAYRADAGRSQIMHVVAAALSPDEIAAVAHYLAACKPATAP